MANDQEKADYEYLLAAGAENSRYKRMMEQQKARADFMRQNSGPSQGQMVSGHYVAPSWSQHLNTLMNAVGSKYMDNKALDSGGKLDDSMKGQNNAILEALMRNRADAQQQQRPQQTQAPVEQGGLPQLSPMDTYRMPETPMWQRSPAEQEGYVPVNYFGGE